MLKVMTVLGTRPEAIKLTPVIQRLASGPDRISVRACVTSHHHQLLDRVPARRDPPPDSDLDVVTAGRTPIRAVGRMVSRLPDESVDDRRPDVPQGAR